MASAREWLRQLCCDPRGREIIAKFAEAEEIPSDPNRVNFNTVRMGDLIKAGFNPFLGGFNYKGDVFMSENLSQLYSKVSSITGYQGSEAELQFAVFVEEAIESLGKSKDWVGANNPSNPQNYPGSAMEQAASEMLVDDYLVSIGAKPRFPKLAGNGFNGYLTWRGPPQQRKVSVTASVTALANDPNADPKARAQAQAALKQSGYGLTALPKDVQNAINNGEILTGWDCSRLH